jgi:uncharacterized protein DUF4118
MQEMNLPKNIKGQDTAARYSFSSSIRAISEKFNANPLVGTRRMPDSICATSHALRVLLFACVMPAAAVSVAAAGTYLMGSTIKYTPNLFFCAVVFSSWLGGLGAGMFSVLLSVIALDYYFIPPIYALGLSLEETPDMIFFVAAGFFVNWVNREGNQAKRSTSEGPDKKNSVFRKKNHELGKGDDLWRADHFSGELADRRLDHESSGAKGIKEFNVVPNPITNKVGADEQLRGERCTQESGRDKKQVVSLNGATRGLECLACLLAHPGREFHVRELIGSVAPAGELGQYRIQQDGYQMTTVRLESGDPILDKHAKAEYKFRLAELREELQEAERFNDPDRVEKIQQESDAIAEQLAAAVGLGGRDRKARSRAERARTAVTKRVRNAIEKIGKTTPSLGRHLATSIKTGYFCCYNPHPDRLVKWKLTS